MRNLIVSNKTFNSFNPCSRRVTRLTCSSLSNRGWLQTVQHNLSLIERLLSFSNSRGKLTYLDGFLFLEIYLTKIPSIGVLIGFSLIVSFVGNDDPSTISIILLNRDLHCLSTNSENFCIKNSFILS